MGERDKCVSCSWFHEFGASCEPLCLSGCRSARLICSFIDIRGGSLVLQQTRVSVVVPYFNNWISKWPTIQDLAAAEHDEVLAAWKGLGYYSRATRLHQAAKLILEDKTLNGSIPEAPEELQKIPGIGSYTAGAISSIAFGRAAPLLDGNVSRVLCRQLGLYADVKKKKVADYLWRAADLLVKNAAGESFEKSSSIPGSWNQALMELGSTVCTPLPKCESCPIQATCKAYAEGEAAASQVTKHRLGTDIEDQCTICEPFEDWVVEEFAENEPHEKETSVVTNSPYFEVRTTRGRKSEYSFETFKRITS